MATKSIRELLLNKGILVTDEPEGQKVIRVTNKEPAAVCFKSKIYKTDIDFRCAYLADVVNLLNNQRYKLAISAVLKKRIDNFLPIGKSIVGKSVLIERYQFKKNITSIDYKLSKLTLPAPAEPRSPDS